MKYKNFLLRAVNLLLILPMWPISARMQQGIFQESLFL